MEPDHSTKRSGAAARPEAAPAQGIERLLRRKGKALTPDLFFRLAEWVRSAREQALPKMTQAAFATKHGIHVRQVQTYEAAARWPGEAKAFVRAHAPSFSSSELTLLFANRSWHRKDALLSALRNHVEGIGRRRRRRGATKQAAADPDLLALQDRLREKLQTRVELLGDGRSGELRVRYFTASDLERLLELLQL